MHYIFKWKTYQHVEKFISLYLVTKIFFTKFANELFQQSTRFKTNHKKIFFNNIYRGNENIQLRRSV